MQQSNYIIEVQGVSKYFGEKVALDNINLNVKKGEFVTILGPSGCGKTTLLRLIAGFQTASEGMIRISGNEITQTPPHLRPVNTVFQKYALFPHLNVFDNIAYGLKIRKVPKDEIKERKGKYYESMSLQGKEFVVNVYGLSPNTEYYYCTWVALNQISNKYFGKTNSFTTLDGTGVPEGKEHPNTNYVAKPFSVGMQRQVYFSPGNLQYQPNATTWRFADEQYNYLGSANKNTALTYDDWIDLFGWSTHEGYSYFGVSTDTTANYYSG